MATFTKRVFTLHAWLGLIAGGFILVFSLTGAALVFSHELDAALNRQQRIIAAPAAGQHPLPYDELYARTRAYAAPRGYAVGAFRELPKQPTGTIDVVLLKGEEYQNVFLNPYTGQVLGPQQHELTRWLLELHYQFFLGQVGEALAACFALALIGSVLTGLVVYRKHLLPVLLFRQKINWRNWRTAASGLHRVLGVWTWLFNLMIATSGVWFLLYLLEPASWQQAPPTAPPAPVATSLDAVVREAQRRLPGARLTYLNFPRAAGATTGQLYLDLPGRWWLGEWATTVTFDARTGQITETQLEADLPLSTQVSSTLGVLHFGQYGGLLLKLLYCFCGLLTSTISLTGFLLWWRRKRPGSARQGALGKRACVSA
ncbi:MAG TPA: PepSY-associated TM helix domain-containing protein [Hymenobacter sp.]|jgi:uncharacterized iron-regulated membrane protein|uniref:PepSY-associated TM helix domain-containing protein n=1 Tax=Hymenobacter sp. TaxID=1898978 RepID=UPI002ED7D867